MNIEVGSGKYVVAVSGGVDSIVLLDLMVKLDRKTEATEQGKIANPSLQLVVAHFDHGIRDDSARDRLFVQKLADKYKLPFVYEEGSLGPETSEATARSARYRFLQKVKKSNGASAIITAHHLDDVLETAIINLLRGTGRRGLSSLKSTADILRPLLAVPKQDILAYAKTHNLKWREDSTNFDERYLRNYVRRQILPHFDPDMRQKFLKHIDDLSSLNKDIDRILTTRFNIRVSVKYLDRHWFVMLPHAVARDVMVSWLRASGITFDKKLIEKLVTSAKTLKVGKTVDIDNRYKLVIEKENLALTRRER